MLEKKNNKERVGITHNTLLRRRPLLREQAISPRDRVVKYN